MKIAGHRATVSNRAPQAMPRMTGKVRMTPALTSGRCTLRRRKIDPFKNSRKQ
ncbi:MAG: hypothetical protein KBG32_03125 [Sulfuritalea sp.]|nr:hypothetical protein [Sulfuritalea sp.]